MKRSDTGMMRLPNYFLADLPKEATLSVQMLTEACLSLKRNREQYLAPRSTSQILEAIAETAAQWLDPEFEFRRMALEEGPAQTGFSSQTIAAGLDHFFGLLTHKNLRELILADLGHEERLDHFCSSETELHLRKASMAVGPRLLVHITGGVLPNPALMSLVLGLLTRSAQFFKCASGTSFFPRLFAHSLYANEPKLGACIAIAEWRGGSSALEAALFAEADCVTATGTDETLEKIRQALPAPVRFIGYGHRVSFAYITHEVLTGYQAKYLVSRMADDVVAWNQLGCLSPHLVYVEHGGAIAVDHFAQMLSEELALREEIEPRGSISVEKSAEIASRRAFYEVRSAHAPDQTRHWFSPESTAWSVVYEADPLFQASCLNRFVYVKGVQDLTQALQSAESVRGHVSTVGLAATENRVRQLSRQLAEWGVTRIAPVGRMQRPSLSWRHDGRPALADLITWADLELENSHW